MGILSKIKNDIRSAVFLQLNTIVYYIDEVCYRFMRNIIGLGKGTPKSRFMLAIANGSFRNNMMIRLLKVIKNIECILMNIQLYIMI